MQEKAVRIPKNKKEWIGFFGSAIVLFIYSILLAQMGFDITDTGYNLTRQYLFLKGYQIESSFWLSDWIGGGWLVLTQSLGWMGASLGWCLLILMLALKWKNLQNN